MFNSSSQLQHWMFEDESQINEQRVETNREFVQKHGAHMTEEERAGFFLSPTDERLLLAQYENYLTNFCRTFSPPMFPSVIGTSLHYFKRFYLNKSTMDFHPKQILVTCVYLACKVEEFNVSISQFIANIKGDKEKAMDIILNNELLLMQQLNFHLTVHNPYRPIEGLLIDIKTHCRALEDPEMLRPEINSYVQKIFLTDSILIYSPSQIALAVVLHAASKKGINIDTYVTDTLLGADGKPHLRNLIGVVCKIRASVKCLENPQKEITKVLEAKLDQCRNEENNPESSVYKRKLAAMLEDEEEAHTSKYVQIAAEQERRERELLGGQQTRITSPGGA